MKHLRPFVIVAIVCSLLFGCSSDDTETPVLTTIEITSPFGSQLILDETAQFSARGLDQSGQPITIMVDITWTVSNANASINNTGMVNTLVAGNVTVTANVEGVEGSLDVVITDIFTQDFHIYVSDAGNLQSPPWQILRYDQNGQRPRVFISQRLAWPQDILFLESRNEVIVSNLNSGRITRYDGDTGDYIDDFAIGIGGPTRMKIGPDGLLYVLQWQGNGRVLRYDLDGNFIDEFTSFSVSNSIGLDWDDSDNLYVSSFDGAFVRKFDSNGNDMGAFISSNLQGPTNIWFDNNGDLLVNDWNAGVIARFNDLGVFQDNFVIGLNQVEGIAFLPGGNFLVGNGNATVKEFSSNGAFVRDFVTRGSGGLIQANAVVRRPL
ncbi:MAG: hypothetical protein AAFX87_27385 [Bacteroidota bacterium]